LLGLSQLGVPELYIYDFDSVEDRNLAGSPYQINNISKSKTDVLKNLIESGARETKFVQAIDAKVSKPKDLIENTNFYIISTDSLESRLDIFRAISSNHQELEMNAFIIDMRSRAKISEVYIVNLKNEVSSFWYEKSIESKLKDTTEPVHCNEANIIQNSYLASSIAIQAFSDILDGDNRTKYFRLSIPSYNISSVEVPLEEFGKKYRKAKLRQPCPICGKKHKSWKKLQSCKPKPGVISKAGKKAGLPERDAIFG
jgi:hypothetical protein